MSEQTVEKEVYSTKWTRKGTLVLADKRRNILLDHERALRDSNSDVPFPILPQSRPNDSFAEGEWEGRGKNPQRMKYAKNLGRISGIRDGLTFSEEAQTDKAACVLDRE